MNRYIAILIAALTSSSTTMKVIGSIASILILSPLTVGLYGIYLGVARDVYPEVKDLFKYINQFLKAELDKFDEVK